ncbi:hypothetical protein [Klebsiella pneumoniae]|uniref:hypothetical protein n=1 Tax=Klebsiella pneumoniae TaxID=573 RepID=UPI00115E92A7|nr:hypothetical protein [Klebsiella pneumoniae]
MKKAIFGATLLLASSTFAGTVDDYLSRHPQLKESATVDIYVKRMAFMMALMDAQQRYNRSDDDFIYQLLSSNGGLC